MTFTKILASNVLPRVFRLFLGTSRPPRSTQSRCALKPLATSSSTFTGTPRMLSVMASQG